LCCVAGIPRDNNHHTKQEQGHTPRAGASFRPTEAQSNQQQPVYSPPLPFSFRCLKHIDEPAGKAAVIWMVGEYGEEITVSAARSGRFVQLPCFVRALADAVSCMSGWGWMSLAKRKGVPLALPSVLKCGTACIFFWRIAEGGYENGSVYGQGSMQGFMLRVLSRRL